MPTPGTGKTLKIGPCDAGTHYAVYTSALAQIGAARAISIGGPTGPDGSSLGFHLQIGVRRSDVEGTLVPPSLEMDQVGVWRFRWGISAGTHTISAAVKQVENVTPRPTLVVKANAAIGVMSDVIATAPSGTGWVTVGPASVTASSPGFCYVELHNNVTATYAKCWWDHLVDT